MRIAKPPAYHFCHVADWRHVPMAYWVHVRVEGALPGSEPTYLPPAPSTLGRLGFPVLRVVFGEHELRFSSVAQLDEAIRVLAMKPLPSTRRLSEARNALEPAPPARTRAQRDRTPAMAGPNSHWLSRLPASLKSTKGRERVVAGLRAVRALAVRGDAFAAPP